VAEAKKYDNCGEVLGPHRPIRRSDRVYCS